MGIFKRFFLFWRKKEEEEKTEEIEEIVEPEKHWEFSTYVLNISHILTWFRREKGISKKDLELVLIDNEEQAAWQVEEAIETLLPDLNLLYIVTDREEVFEELSERAFQERGLLVMFLCREEKEAFPGNMILDFCDWEKHLDIISAVSYNTLTI